jgi:hypothetical protein
MKRGGDEMRLGIPEIIVVLVVCAIGALVFIPWFFIYKKPATVLRWAV